MSYENRNFQSYQQSKLFPFRIHLFNLPNRSQNSQSCNVHPIKVHPPPGVSCPAAKQLNSTFPTSMITNSPREITLPFLLLFFPHPKTAESRIRGD
ncbi:hypothetical protein TNCT_70181 [Trichonephila clavata]|uniref:Uncharacterized protein n=1 Tax=Trichonephila clavata TaxID=2740835 RepID=A0A8X6J8C9_TRICU|nr:hypothetical protein TNCT_70181 [Trichonephila clavata]